MVRSEQASASTASSSTGVTEENFRVQAPALSLPKGGGAIKGIGEKFAAHPVTGTGSMSVPIATSPGRNGFGPQLSLSYDSGAGNGAFGLGWSLSIPSITRRTDKGLPRYMDPEESDVFVLSGAEDLVPVLRADGARWEITRTLNGEDHLVHRYRPRIEGLFARIERWTRKSDGDTAWRSISKDNTITWYGTDANSRIADPNQPTRIFSWLLCQSYDDKGNAMSYVYVAENDDGIDLSQPCEQNRTPTGRSAQRYLERIRYGNRKTTLDDQGQRPVQLSAAFMAPAAGAPAPADWMFEVVFDHGRGHYQEDALDDDERVFVTARLAPDPLVKWAARQDPFSTCRSGFDVRTYRLCRRVLMFHHFTAELGTPDYLVRSTSFRYQEGPVASFITSVEQSGFVRRANGKYLKRSMPEVRFTYSEVVISSAIGTLTEESMQDMPQGVEGAYQFVDLDGEGNSGVLTEQADAWYYKPPLGDGQLGAMAVVARKPNASLNKGAQLLDLAGDGHLDLVDLRGPIKGFYERNAAADWEPMRALRSVPNIAWDDPNVRFVDLNGDGHADVMITEHDAITWYPSLAEEGFGASERVTVPFDEEKGPAPVLTENTQSIFLADMSGDGLTDLVRLRHSEVCYWPNLGHGRFGAKVVLNKAPLFDHPDQFDPQRIRLVDIDGSGTTDILYLAADRVRVLLNQSGNALREEPSIAHAFPYDELKNVSTADVLGKGTGCLVWTSSLPGDERAPMKFIDLMKEGKPHLLREVDNGLGAVTHIHYKPSTFFYFQDKQAGRPWITRLAFPVHVVERVETYDHIGRNRFVVRYAYHHGYFDGEEREFRGFGMVEQFDTEQFAVLSNSDALPVGDNINERSHVPPVHTKTWYHTGAFLDDGHIAQQFTHEYFREPGMTDAQFEAQLLPDTVLPAGLTAAEMRQACRALKGSILRQEVYADDGPAKAGLPYSVSERSYNVRLLAPCASNRHAVFLTTADESVEFHYERDVRMIGGVERMDPRISHSIELETDNFGNVLKSASIGYGRRTDDPDLKPGDQAKQRNTLITYTENEVTHAIDLDDVHRVPLPSTADTYELTGFALAAGASRYAANDLVEDDPTRPGRRRLVAHGTVAYESEAPGGKQKRLIERLRTYYRSDDLTARLALGVSGNLALPFERYKLALTGSLVNTVFLRGRQAPLEQLLPNAANVIESTAADGGGYVDLDHDDNWWVASGRTRYTTDDTRSAAEELVEARAHFFLTGTFKDPFAAVSAVTYDAHDLAVIGSRDAIGNTVSATVDYRVLQPVLVTDPNGNRTQVAFDALGLVAGTAIMGAATGARKGDLLDGFEADPTNAQLRAFLQDPLADPRALLQRATTCQVYDLFAYQRTKALAAPQPVFVGTIVRETHDADLPNNVRTKVQVSVSYSDGAGHEVQQKIQAEPGPVENGGAVVTPRWVGSGWTIYNNKGAAVRRYEPFFTSTHAFEFKRIEGVSSTLLYDPAERVVATIHPDHSWEKVVFDPWKQITYDVNDLIRTRDVNNAESDDPKNDPDMGGYFTRLPNGDYLPTWYALRKQPANLLAFTQAFPGADDRAKEIAAADKAFAHRHTPSIVHLDQLGRTVLTIADNGGVNKFESRVVLDIEGNQREVIDALGRVVMRYAYDMLGTRIRQSSMEAGARWMLNDCLGRPIRSWDERGHTFRITYDALRRPLASFCTGADLNDRGRELRVEQTIYGEGNATGLTPGQRREAGLLGRVHRHFDQAGVVTSEGFDFKGNPLGGTRRLAKNYKTAVDLAPLAAFVDGAPNAPFDTAGFNTAMNGLLETEAFTSSTTFDALNRPLAMTTPDGSVITPQFNEANLLEAVRGMVRGTDTVFVRNIDHNAKGQREAIVYGNNVRTGYTYDKLTFRLRRLVTTRSPQPADEVDDAPQWPGNGLQDLRYTYDPAGNLTCIRDNAQQKVFFNNRRVDPINEYTYDAIYRLIEASGREQLGQAGAIAIVQDDLRRSITAAKGDGQAMGRYLQRYVYDAVGNIGELQHQSIDQPASSWSRSYTYNEDSLLQGPGNGGRKSNRLSNTKLNPDRPTRALEEYVHDFHGNMVEMPHLAVMEWDHHDQLHMTQRQQVNVEDTYGQEHTGERTYYVYDSSGQRVRKITERAGASPKRMKERIYLGSWETYREYENNGTDVKLERETLHVMDDKQRICLVETKRPTGILGRIWAAVAGPDQLFRYQLGNHLGSASVEVDGDANVISYEEFFPYGSTSYHMLRSGEVSEKRYRYTGKERDVENGMDYFGARYYMAWLGRWSRTDPKHLADGPCPYAYSRNSPICRLDPDGNQSADFQPPQKAIGGFSAADLHQATLTVFGEMSAQLGGTLTQEANAVASTIFNRARQVEPARQAAAAAKEKYVQAQATHKAAETALVTAKNAVPRAKDAVAAAQRRVTRDEGALKRAEAGLKTAQGAKADKREAAVKAATAKLESAKTQLATSKTGLGAAQAALASATEAKDKAQKAFDLAVDGLTTAYADFRAADDKRISAESFLKDNKGDPTLTSVVTDQGQYIGHAPGVEMFNKRDQLSPADRTRQAERWRIAKEAVERLAGDASKADPFIEFRSNRKGERKLGKGQQRIGGNDFWK